MIQLITGLSIIVLIVVGAFLLSKEVKQYRTLKTQGVVKDYWDKFSPALLIVGVALLGTFFGVSEDTFNTIFNQFGNIVYMVDGLIGAITVFIGTLKGIRCVSQ